jgi:hypothetical protein
MGDDAFAVLLLAGAIAAMLVVAGGVVLYVWRH